jgi:hypothetical protein
METPEKWSAFIIQSSRRSQRVIASRTCCYICPSKLFGWMPGLQVMYDHAPWAQKPESGTEYSGVTTTFFQGWSYSTMDTFSDSTGIDRSHPAAVNEALQASPIVFSRYASFVMETPDFSVGKTMSAIMN